MNANSNTTLPRKELGYTTSFPGGTITTPIPNEEEVLAAKLAEMHSKGELDDKHGVSYLLGNRRQRRNLALRQHSKERRQYHKPGHKGYSF